jgi:predicted nucleotidyltransferase component of viral defense system
MNSAKKLKNLEASIKQRLLNISKEKKEDFTFTLTHYIIERLLFRLGQSTYRNSFILKGALLFSVYMDSPHRSTRDIDFLSFGEPSLPGLENIFKGICSQEVENDGVVFDYRNITAMQIREDNIYQGVRLNIQASLDTAVLKVQVDVGFGDSVYTDPKEREYSHLLDFPAPKILMYPPETVIAEKLEALVTLGMASSRMKDIYDLHILITNKMFDKDKITEAISATFERRNTSIPTGIPSGLSDDFAADKEKTTQWNAFLKKIGINHETLKLKEVIWNIRVFALAQWKEIAR